MDIKKSVLEGWLDIELRKTAYRVGYVSEDTSNVSYEFMLQTIRCLDRESVKDKVDRNYIINVLALMWEHTDHNSYDIRAVVLRFLTRIGYPTSAIVTDKGFDAESCQFTSINSIIDEIAITAKLQRNEVNVGEHKYLLTHYQKSIWNALESEKNICISAPTSAGKSFVIMIYLVKKLLNQSFDIVYIVPTISLVNQVTEDFHKTAIAFKLSDYNLTNSYDPNIIQSRNIYVLTQEKAIMALLENDACFIRDTVVVADEIQNIERILDENDERAKVLFDVLQEFRDRKNVLQTVLSGPRIDKIGIVGSKIWGEDVCEFSTNESPVLNITYSVRKIGSKYFLKQYNGMLAEPLTCEIHNRDLISGYGKKLYTNEYLNRLNTILNNIGMDNQTIVFAPTSKTARKIALNLRCGIGKEQELVDYYKETIHPQYSLCKTIHCGVAYHHGKLPLHVRRTLEKAISEGRIKTVVCTTTLLQGVNLPAQNIIIRNPHLYINKSPGSTELSNYEMANLRGRAGRLLKEFIGRTYVLDESGFIETDGYEQKTLFDDSYKELPTGYESKFNEYYEDIKEAVNGDEPVNNDMYAYGYLVTYIRQNVLKYGKGATKKMKNVGIKLSQKQVAAIIKKLEELTIPREICFKNRYWDPFVLNHMYKNYKGDPPATIMERGAKSHVSDMMKFLRDDPVTCPIYEKYVPPKYRKGRMRHWLIDKSFQWATDMPLKQILSEDYYNGSNGADRIEETIDVLQNTISYNLPLLLKPLFDMKRQENNVIRSFQAGTNNPVVAEMINMGIPRETALYLCLEIRKKPGIDEVSSNSIKNSIGRLFNTFPYWIQVQLEYLV